MPNRFISLSLVTLVALAGTTSCGPYTSGSASKPTRQPGKVEVTTATDTIPWTIMYYGAGPVDFTPLDAVGVPKTKRGVAINTTEILANYRPLEQSGIEMWAAYIQRRSRELAPEQPDGVLHLEVEGPVAKWPLSEIANLTEATRGAVPNKTVILANVPRSDFAAQIPQRMADLKTDNDRSWEALRCAEGGGLYLYIPWIDPNPDLGPRYQYRAMLDEAFRSVRDKPLYVYVSPHLDMMEPTTGKSRPLTEAEIREMLTETAKPGPRGQRLAGRILFTHGRAEDVQRFVNLVAKMRGK
jgi:hypothetical protein